MNETRERFLKAILEHVPAERIVEIHFFPPIRQGQVETGVAVVAVALPPSTFGLPDSRLEVHSASYRLTRKGPERGKWSVDMKPEADAPFATVDIVVRGVQQRAGEALEAERITGPELLALLSEPAWQPAP